jgi:hypothetical protein
MVWRFNTLRHLAVTGVSKTNARGRILHNIAHILLKKQLHCRELVGEFLFTAYKQLL